MPKHLSCLSCPVCARRKHSKKLRMRAYGSRRQRVWCGQCDRFFGPVGFFSKKTARQQAHKAVRGSEPDPKA